MKSQTELVEVAALSASLRARNCGCKLPPGRASFMLISWSLKASEREIELHWLLAINLAQDQKAPRAGFGNWNTEGFCEAHPLEGVAVLLLRASSNALVVGTLNLTRVSSSAGI